MNSLILIIFQLIALMFIFNKYAKYRKMYFELRQQILREKVVYDKPTETVKIVPEESARGVG